MAKIFISYRRNDSAGHAGRVHDRLEREFGRDLLFMDVDTIPLGANFVKVLGDEVAKCDAFLALIGPGWIDARDEDGQRRLDNPKDPVRVEVATALQRGIPVIPILLEGTRIPRADQLPRDLEELSLRNGLDVRHASFHQDMDKLIRGLKAQAGRAEAEPDEALNPIGGLDTPRDPRQHVPHQTPVAPAEARHEAMTSTDTWGIAILIVVAVTMVAIVGTDWGLFLLGIPAWGVTYLLLRNRGGAMRQMFAYLAGFAVTLLLTVSMKSGVRTNGQFVITVLTCVAAPALAIRNAMARWSKLIKSGSSTTTA